MYFLQASVTSVGIKALTYLGLMANRRDSDHHNNDDGNDVDNIVLTRAEFLEFRKEARDENQQFLEKSRQIIDKIEQKIVTLLVRKSSHMNNVEYIQGRTPNYKKIPFFDEDMCKLDFINWCTVHQLRHGGMLTWLNPDSTRGMAVTKEKERWLGEGIFGPCQLCDHFGEE